MTKFDDFDGETSYATDGPFAIEKGDAAVQLIQKCAEPWDKKCRCPAHMEYFNGNLD